MRVLISQSTAKRKKSLSKVSNLLNNFYKFALTYNPKGVEYANNRKAFFCALNSYIGSIPPCISIMEILPFGCKSAGKVEPFFYSQPSQIQTNIFKNMTYIKNFCLLGSLYPPNTQGTGEIVLILNALISKSKKTLSKVSNLYNKFYKFALHYITKGVKHANNRGAFFCALSEIYTAQYPRIVSVMDAITYRLLVCSATGKVEPFFYSQPLQIQTNIFKNAL